MSLKKSMRHNESGQAAIFIVLIFPILFVLFTMAINVGLIVHDKINLQNSVDLAAYYGAQKQAEILNSIAHNNYLIRQSWKLLNWRYWALGQSGYVRNEFPGYHGSNDDSMFIPMNPNQFLDSQNRPFFPPGVCVNHQPMWPAESGDTPSLEGNCNREFLKVYITDNPPAPLDLPKPVTIFNGPVAAILDSIVSDLKQSFNNQGRCYGLRNFYTAASFFLGYLHDQANRKQVIRALAFNLSKPSDQVRDIDGDLIIDGVRKTFTNNLTEQNGSNVISLKYFNSMSGTAQGQVESDEVKWLPEIVVAMALSYVDFKVDPGVRPIPGKILGVYDNSGNSRLTQPAEIANAQLCGYNSSEELNQIYGFLAGIMGLSKGHLHRSAVGVEKNPWYLVYSGVEAETQSRQLFHPFGESVTIKARGFAKPFGGRIGPWYSTHWPQGNSTSSSGQSFEKIDKLLPPRLSDQGFTTTNDQKINLFVPNYSRYPGDSLGMYSKMALSNVKIPLAPLSQPPFFEHRNYLHLLKPIEVENSLAPIAAVPTDVTKPTGVRSFPYEMAATLPDLFDLQYFTIMANYGQVLASRLRNGLLKNGYEGSSFPIRGDLGNASIQTVINQYGVQTETARHTSYYLIKDWAHLLNSWVTENWPPHYDGQFPKNYFGKCYKQESEYRPNQQNYTPENCIAGGRSGYSVKIVSQQALEGKIKVYNNEGDVLNPPTEPSSWTEIK